MPETMYKTAEAAAQLSMNQYHLRRLIDVGLVDADRTEGGHWRIPHREVERLKKEGVPPIPARVEKTTARSHENPATPSAAAIAPSPASPEVRDAADQVTITRSRLEQRKTELELEEIEDRFEERERKRHEQEAEQFRRQAERQRQAARRSWEESTIENALRALPFDCDGETRLDAERRVRTALQPYDQESGSSLVNRLARAAVEAALVPWHARKDAEARAQRHAANKEAVLSLFSVWMLWKASDAERKEALRIARQAIDETDEDATFEEMREMVDQALKPLERQVRQRMENDEAKRAVDQAVLRGRSHVGTVLRRDYEFDSIIQELQALNEYPDAIAEDLRAALESGEIEPSDVEEWVENWLDENVEEEED